MVVDSRSESLRFGMIVFYYDYYYAGVVYVCVVLCSVWREVVEGNFWRSFSACQDRTDSV